MTKKIDLSVFKEDYLELTLIDGTEINIKKPSQKLLLMLMGIEKVSKEDSNAGMAAILDLFLAILNNNKEKRTFTIDDVADYDIGLIRVVIEAYTQFMGEVMSNPN